MRSRTKSRMACWRSVRSGMVLILVPHIAHEVNGAGLRRFNNLRFSLDATREVRLAHGRPRPAIACRDNRGSVFWQTRRARGERKGNHMDDGIRQAPCLAAMDIARACVR